MSGYTKVSVSNSDESSSESEFKVYKLRWFILLMFVCCCASSVMQWVQYSIIANIVVDFYEVTYTAADWSSMIYFIVYIPCIFPACYVLDRLGLRIAILIGIGGTCIGSWIKVGSVSPDRYWMVLLGQAVVGASQVFMFGMPPKVAAVWFGAKHVSSACSIGIFGVQLGTALGFVIPPLMVNNSSDKESEGYGLYLMLITLAIITTILLIIVFLFFKERPLSPPSLAQAQISQMREYDNFTQSLRELFSNYSYVLLVISYGINLGIFMAISTLLNQIMLRHYPNSEVDAGRVGLLLVLAGMVGSVTSGVVLDNFNRFKETVVVVYVASLLSMIAFTFTLDQGVTFVYFVAAILGFFVIALFTVGYELAAELTYPVEEGTSGGILAGAAQVFGIAFTYLYSYLHDKASDRVANLAMCGSATVSVILIAFIRYDLKRRAVQEQGKTVKHR